MFLCAAPRYKAGLSIVSEPTVVVNYRLGELLDADFVGLGKNGSTTMALKYLCSENSKSVLQSGITLVVSRYDDHTVLASIALIQFVRYSSPVKPFPRLYKMQMVHMTI